jgi:hypothetical protein
MYGRDFKLVVPIASQKILRDTERKMIQHFGGVSVFPIVKGFWVDQKTHKMYEDDNLVMSSTKSYEGEHPIVEHQKDWKFMSDLAQEVGRKTHQKSMFLEEDLVWKCKFIEIQSRRRGKEKLEKVV